ncbi:hypothetical protein ACS0TY_008713 [Phlomoides rotata]
MRNIERLPEAVHSSVRSGVVITDLTRIVEELVFNSLDAGATEVSVSVGLSSSYLKVVDNGSGIPRDGLVLLGERYVTSKVDHLALEDTGSENFDSHGEALCSISDISLLEIVTKTRGKPNGYRKIVKKCNCLFLGINDDRQDVGTTVIVHDIFYNQPVRRKHMQSSPKKVLDSIKMSVLRIALVHFNVSFKVVDVESVVELFQAGPLSSPLPLLSSHFGIENSANFHKLNLSDGELKLSGYISDPREIFSLKAIQYVYINSRFIYKGPIHKLVNQLAAKFDVLSSWQLTTSSQSGKQNKYDMCPAFILNLQCPRSYYAIMTSDRSRTSVEFKDWSFILAFIENGVMHLWTKNIPPGTFETGKKRFRKQNSPTPLDIGSPQLKKICKIQDNLPDLEGFVVSSGKPFRKVSDFKKHPTEADLLSETDYLSQACDGSHAVYDGIREKEIKNHLSPFSVSSPPLHVAYTYGKKEDGISSSVLRNILPAHYEKIDNVSRECGVSVDCLDFGDDIHIDQGRSKSFLRSCSFEKSLLHERKPPGRDDMFEFGSDDTEIKKRWFECCDSTKDETGLAICGPDLQSDAALPFQYSPMIQYDMHKILKFPIHDSIESSFLHRNVLPDFSKQVWNSTSSWQSFRSGWSPVTAKKTIGSKSFEEDDDAVYKDLFEGFSEFGTDTVHRYSAQHDLQDLKHCPNTKFSWLDQNCSFTSFSPDYKRKTGEFCRGDIDDMFSPKPLKRFTETTWSLSPWCSEETPKNYSVASLYDTSPAEHEYGRHGSRNQVPMLNEKKPLRSHSAPPSWKGKKRYMDLADSSTMFYAKGDLQNVRLAPSSTEPSNTSHGKRHAETMSFKCSQKSFGQYHSSQMERPVEDCSVAESSGLEITPEFIRIQNIEPEQSKKFINTDSVERQDLKDHQDSFVSEWKWRNCHLPYAGESRSDIIYNQDTILDISSNILHLDGDSLLPKSIERASLENATVLNQVDKKFIAVVAGKILTMIDQHAADERIRVEELRHKVLSGEMKKITYLDAEHELVLPEVGYQLLHNYVDQIQAWGWICNIHVQDTNSFTKHLDFLHRQPTAVKLLGVPCILGVNLNDIDLLEFLQQLADTDGSSTVPPSVHRVLNNKACRGAIMFGDALLPSECSLIVQELKQTSLCFQCAHGRPTTVPLVDLDLLHKKVGRLGSDECWHGLRKHKVSLKRTSHRLSSALS